MRQAGNLAFTHRVDGPSENNGDCFGGLLRDVNGGATIDDNDIDLETDQLGHKLPRGSSFPFA